MQVFVAESAGFCFGVKRAIDIAQKIGEAGTEKVFSLGPLIHNRHVVDQLAAKGIKSVDDLEEIKKGKVIIRSHGVGPKTLQFLKNFPVEIVDATCPFVKKAQEIAQELNQKGLQVIILGDANHPEVKGIVEWTNGKAIVINTLEEAAGLDAYSRVGFLAQTTQQEENFHKAAEVLKNNCSELIVHNTICSATKIRQVEAFQLAQQVELMIVIGGLHSSNTKKLASICRRAGTPTHHLEDASELDPLWFYNAKTVGVTAGASTPDWIIEEVVQKMTELNDEKMKNAEEVQKEQPSEKLEEVNSVVEKSIEEKAEEVDLNLADNLQELHKGDLTTGTVVQITDNEVMIDVGGKSEGIIPLNELSHRHFENSADIVKVGEKIRVYVLRVENEEGHPVLSKKRADRQVAWEKLEQVLDSGEEIRAEVIEVVKGGLLVDVGVRGFVPASLVERGYVEDLNQYLGKELRLKVIELDRSKNKVVLSQKVILDAEHENLKKATWDKLGIGQVVKGVVRRLTNFGAFVDIGGIDGLLHVSELSWGRIDHPQDVLSEGQEIEVKILGIDREAEKVSLGLKQLLDNPWDTAETHYPVGSIVNGKVLRIAPFGAFVEVEPGIEGLVHISQIADHHVAKTEDVVSVGDEIPVKILNVDQNAHRMSLSLKEAQVQEKPKREEVEPQENNGDTGVKLGDLFGELFEAEKNE